MTTAKPLPPHGRRARYMAGCHCDQCTRAHNRYCKQYEHRSRGRTQRLLVDAAPYRTLLQRYRDAGWSYARIGRAFNVSHTAVSDILGGQPTLLPSTAARLDAFRGAPDARPHVPSIGAVRRMRALYAAGHVAADISAAGGPGTSTVRYLLHRARPTIYVETADAAAAAYQALRDTQGTSTRAQRTAQANGWEPPQAWHDDDLDAPEAEPGRWRSTRDAEAAARAAEVEHLASFGFSREHIAERLGLEPKYVRDILTGHGPGWRVREKASA